MPLDAIVPMMRSDPESVAVIGGGPAGLMAAETLAAAGVRVDLYDRMPSVGRKFLIAGRGGLNLTHDEPFERFVERFGPRRDVLEPMLRRFGPADLRSWAAGLGIETFVGSSGRVFPIELKAAPMLRAWLRRLGDAGVRLHARHRWVGWQDDALRFETPGGEVPARPSATVLALGGASWPRLGSDGRWVALLEANGVAIAPLRPSNCGFDVARLGADGSLQPGWSDHFRERHAGEPLKNVALGLVDGRMQKGEFVVTAGGVEGSLVYAHAAPARDRIDTAGCAELRLDLLPARSAEAVREEVARPRGARSWSTHLKSRLKLDGVKLALLHELLPPADRADPARLAAGIKSLPMTWTAPRSIEEAISSAGGVRFDALGAGGTLRARPGVWCAGEMLDWEAPTGGYLLTASLASGRWAAEAVLRSLARGRVATC